MHTHHNLMIDDSYKVRMGAMKCKLMRFDRLLLKPSPGANKDRVLNAQKIDEWPDNKSGS